MRGDVATSLLFVIASLAVLACDTNPGRKLAFTTNDAGQVLVHYKPCNQNDAVVTRVKLVRVKGRIYGDADDPVLWEIENATGMAEGTFTIGVAPAGFEEKVALAEQPLHATRLGLLLYTPRKRSAADTFRLADLRSDFVLSGRDYLPEEVFFKKYTCW